MNNLLKVRSDIKSFLTDKTKEELMYSYIEERLTASLLSYIKEIEIAYNDVSFSKKTVKKVGRILNDK